jgi:hypothetical protein
VTRTNLARRLRSEGHRISNDGFPHSFSCSQPKHLPKVPNASTPSRRKRYAILLERWILCIETYGVHSGVGCDLPV